MDIIAYYGIELDKKLLDRLPANKIKVNSVTNEMIVIHFDNTQSKRKSLLTMHDGLHVKGLASVASYNGN